MGNLKKWGKRVLLAATIIVVTAVVLSTIFILVLAFLAGEPTEGEKSCAAEMPGVDVDHIGVMNRDTEVTLREHGYVPDGTCGFTTASHSSFPIAIGRCEGTYTHNRYSPPIAYVITARPDNPADQYASIYLDSLEQLPDVADLIATDPRFAHC